MRYFTHYWSNETWEFQEPGGLLEHTAGNQFRRKGVQPGDRIFIVTVVKGELRLGGAIDAERVIGQREAERELGDGVWEASDHVLARKATAMPFNPRRAVPVGIVERLRFSGGQAPKFSAPGRLDKQTMRGVRELSRASAELLNAELGQRPATSPIDKPPTAPPSGKGSQGWQSDPAKRRLVEDHAQTLLEEHYRRKHWSVEPKQYGNPFDAVATKGKQTRYLEAKGTETDGASVLVTKGEVRFARAHPGECVIGIVSGIEFLPDGALDDKSGTLATHEWDPDAGVLTAQTYTWKPPEK